MTGTHALSCGFFLSFDFTNMSKEKCGRRVCGGLVYLHGVYENMDVFIKRARDGLEASPGK